MKSRRAALHTNRILWREASEALLAFISWKEFELYFISKFCPKNEAMVALTKLELTQYYQGQKLVDDHIDEFSELVKEAGYSDNLGAIVMKFQKGLDWDNQDCITEMVQGRPEDNNPVVHSCVGVRHQLSCKSGIPQHTAHGGTNSRFLSTIFGSESSAPDQLCCSSDI